MLMGWIVTAVIEPVVAPSPGAIIVYFAFAHNGCLDNCVCVFYVCGHCARQTVIFSHFYHCCGDSSLEGCTVLSEILHFCINEFYLIY